nr:immunoglobulin heavy chain junction region [Mus musculus]
CARRAYGNEFAYW